MEVTFESFRDSEVGQLEAFLSDGLRSLLDSYRDVPEMTESTCAGRDIWSNGQLEQVGGSCHHR